MPTVCLKDVHCFVSFIYQSHRVEAEVSILSFASLSNTYNRSSIESSYLVAPVSLVPAMRIEGSDLFDRYRK